MTKEILMTIVEYGVRVVVLVIGAYIIEIIKQYNLEKWVEFCIRAAEQLAEVGIIDFNERKDYVRQKVLEKFKISDEELDILIEAGVEELNRLKNIENNKLST